MPARMNKLYIFCSFFIYIIHHTAGQCAFDASLKASAWFEFYDGSRNNWVNEYLDSGDIKVSAPEVTAIDISFTNACLMYSEVSSTQFYYQYTSSGTSYCVDVTVTSQALFLKRQSYDGSSTTVDQCGSLSNPEILWLPKYPVSQQTGITCPFTAGSYTLASPSGGSCTGSDLDTASVTGSTFTITICSNDVLTTIEYKCLGYLDDNDGNGGNILLADQTVTDKPYYRCGRFSDADGVLQMSLLLHYRDSPFCGSSMSFDTPEGTNFGVGTDARGESFSYTLNFVAPPVEVSTTTSAADLTTVPTAVPIRVDTTQAPEVTTKAPEVTTGPAQACSYPSELFSVRWWYAQAELNGVPLLYEVVFTESSGTYSRALELQISTLDPSVFSSATCILGTQTGNTIYTTLNFDTGNTGQCEQIVIGDSALLVRTEVDILATRAEECITLLQASNSFRVLVSDSAYSNHNLLFTGRTCPFPNGQYYLSIQENTNEFCDRDSSSTITVSGKEMTVSSCKTNNVYKKPYNTKLYCGDSFSREDVEDSGASGDYLVLAAKFGANNVVYFYCAKYEVVGEDVYLSINHGSSDMIDCYTDKTPYSASKDLTAFSLLKNFPTTTTEPPTTTTTQPPQPTTTESPYACVYPEELRDSPWWYGVQPFGNTYLQYNVYFEMEGNTHSRTLKLGVGEAMSEFSSADCEQRIQTDNRTIHTIVDFTSTSSVNRQCEQLVIGDHVLLSRTEVTEAPAMVTDCPAALLPYTIFRAQVKASSYLGEEMFSGSECPFPNGAYQATFTDSQGQTQCDRDFTSHAYVTGNMLWFDTCLDANTYARPYRTRLRCGDFFRREEVESTGAEGDYLILGGLTGEGTEKTRFYCAKYVFGPGFIKISLNHKTETIAECDTNRGPEHAGDGYTFFYLRESSLLRETTAERNPTTTITTTVKEQESTTKGQQTTTPVITTDGKESMHPDSTASSTIFSSSQLSTDIVSAAHSTSAIESMKSTSSMLASAGNSILTTFQIYGATSGTQTTGITSSIPGTTTVSTSSKPGTTTTMEVTTTAPLPTTTLPPSSVCTFGEDLLDGVFWSEVDSTVGISFVYTAQFTQDDSAFGISYSLGQTEIPSAARSCNTTSENGPAQWAIMTSSTGDDITAECAQIMRSEDAILYRSIGIDASMVGLIDVPECAAPMKSQDELQALFKMSSFADENNMFPGTVCPFAQKEYNTTYSVTSGDYECEGDGASTITISGNQIFINTCSSANTYTEPLRTTLTCVSFWDANIVEEHNKNGDFLLLAGKTTVTSRRKKRATGTPTERVVFYCARYYIEDNQIMMSINAQDPDKTLCMTGQHYTDSGSDIVAFRLITDGSAFPANETIEETTTTNKSEMTTTKEVKETTVSETNPPNPPSEAPTARPPTPKPTSCLILGCSNRGRCEQNIFGLYECQCNEGYKGYLCEMDIDECEQYPCKHGATCQNMIGGYYCICPPNYLGKHCDTPITPEPTPAPDADNTITIIIICVVLGVLLLTIVIIAVARCNFSANKKEKVIMTTSQFIKPNTVTFKDPEPTYASVAPVMNQYSPAPVCVAPAPVYVNPAPALCPVPIQREPVYVTTVPSMRADTADYASIGHLYNQSRRYSRPGGALRPSQPYVNSLSYY